MCSRGNCCAFAQAISTRPRNDPNFRRSETLLSFPEASGHSYRRRDFATRWKLRLLKRAASGNHTSRFTDFWLFYFCRPVMTGTGEVVRIPADVSIAIPALAERNEYWEGILRPAGLCGASAAALLLRYHRSELDAFP